MASITLGGVTIPMPDKPAPKRVSKPQKDYILKLLDELAITPVTEAELSTLDCLLYDEAGAVLDTLSPLMRKVRRDRRENERALLTRLPYEVGTKTLVDGVITERTWVSHEHWSGSWLVTVISENKYRVVMFTSADWAQDHTIVGCEVSIAGTVKVHSEFRGAWSTTLVRPSLKSIIRPSKEATA